MNRTDRVDRTCLAILGVALLGVGSYALARSYGALGDVQAHQPILLERVRTFVGRNHDWFWPLAFVVAIIVAYLGYQVVRTKLRPHPHSRDMHVTDGDDDLVMHPTAIADAIADDITQDHNIPHARARLVHTEPNPELDLSLSVADDLPIDHLRQHIEHDILERAQHAMQSPTLHARITIALTKPAGRHVA